MAQKFRLGLVQMSCPDDDNLEKAITKVREAAARGAQIVCLQELFRTEYFCREEVNAARFDLAETIPGPATEALGKVARELGVVIVASLFEKRTAGLYHNTAVVLSTDGSIAGVYRKMHIPDDPQYFEKYYFTPGDTGFGAIDTPFARIGVLVCWDQWYPEAARITAMSGADVLIYPTAIGWLPADKEHYGESQRDAWITIQRSHAIANGIYVAAINRIGWEGASAKKIEFWGSSFVADPQGRFLAQASTNKEEILIVECDPQLMEDTRRGWPFFRDRRVDAYGPILNRWISPKGPGSR
ncbi:MAG: carbon-nitrogen hydrolase [Acidobacteriota bacterium]